MADVNDLAKLADNPALLERQLSKLVETAMAVATTYGLAIVGAVIILIVGWSLAGFLHRAVMRAGRRAKNLDITLFSFAASMARYAVLFLRSWRCFRVSASRPRVSSLYLELLVWLSGSRCKAPSVTLPPG